MSIQCYATEAVRFHIERSFHTNAFCVAQGEFPPILIILTALANAARTTHWCETAVEETENNQAQNWRTMLCAMQGPVHTGRGSRYAPRSVWTRPKCKFGRPLRTAVNSVKCVFGRKKLKRSRNVKKHTNCRLLGEYPSTLHHPLCAINSHSFDQK